MCWKNNNGLTEGLVRSVTTIPDFDEDGILDANDVDDNNNGLIDIRTAEEFNNIRHNLAGTGYNTGEGYNNTKELLQELITALEARQHFVGEEVISFIKMRNQWWRIYYMYYVVMN